MSGIGWLYLIPAIVGLIVIFTAMEMLSLAFVDKKVVGSDASRKPESQQKVA